MKNLKEEIDEEINYINRVIGDLEACDGFLGITKEEALNYYLEQSLNRIAKKTAEALAVDNMGLELPYEPDENIFNCGFNEAVDKMESKRNNFFK